MEHENDIRKLAFLYKSNEMGKCNDYVAYMMELPNRYKNPHECMMICVQAFERYQKIYTKNEYPKQTSFEDYMKNLEHCS